MLDSLQAHFRRSVPVGFIDQLIRRQTWIYEEARQHCFSNAVWGEAEARWMLGYTERSLFESELRRAAIAVGLHHENAEHLGNNCTYVRVSAGNFRITAHRVPTAGSFVPVCESRKQDAAVNKFMDGYVLDGILTAPLPKLERAKEIAIYLLHGAVREADGKRKLFLEVAAPDSELELYRWHCSLEDLRQAYLADARDAGLSIDLEDKAKPTPKKGLSNRSIAENE